MKTNLISHSATARRSRLSAAFSLVEVVLAVGIMALGVVTILGLLPHGMEISRKTANELAETRIIEQLVAELQSSEWDDIEGAKQTISAQTRYFDDQGLELAETDSDLEALVTYVARVRVPDLNVRLPTNATAISENQNLRRVTIEVASVPLTNFNFDDPPAGVAVKTFTQLLARMR